MTTTATQAAERAAVVQIRGLTKRFGEVTAVRDLNLDVYAGEVLGFLGDNGSGKTTTMKLLLGLLRPSAGEISLFGQPLATHLPQLLRRVGAIIEAPAFYPYLSGWDNLRLLAQLDGTATSAITAALAEVDLQSAARRKFETYSLGMKQRLGIAAALMRDPALIILDEPTSGLDPGGQREVRELIPRLAGEGRTIFISSHIMYEVQQVCDRVAIMKQGELVALGPVASLLASDDRLLVRVADLAAAEQTLRRLDWVRSVELVDGMLVLETPVERAADVTAALARDGLFVSELRPREQSLEAAFFALTGAEEVA